MGTVRRAFSSYTHSEGRTGLGQHVQFAAPSDAVGAFKEALGMVRSVTIPTTHRTNVQHGGYGRYTRYHIKQLEYAGGGGGFIEAIEVRDAPEGRCAYILHEFDSRDGSTFVEWATREDAIAAWKAEWGAIRRHADRRKAMEQRPGFLRFVVCGVLTPWFYAIGDEELYGDYTVPDGIQDDPVYRLGRRFIMRNRDGLPVIKTCMGCRFVSGNLARHENDSVGSLRLVYWHDGTYFSEHLPPRGASPDPWRHTWRTDGCTTDPRLLEGDEEWIAEAVDEFRTLLAGGSTGFSMHFLDGTRMTVTIKPRVKPMAAGTYYAKVTFDDGTMSEGTVEFTPTLEAPDVASFITQRFASGVGTTRKTVTRVEVTQKQVGKKGASLLIDDLM